MKWLMSLFLVLALFVATSVTNAAIEIALEAELASILKAPMVVGDDEPDTSNNQYIWAAGAPATGGGGAGWAEFVVNIPQPGKYALWGRVIAWDGNSDSFWVTWQPSDPDEDPQVTQNVEFRWGVAQTAAWRWDRINHWLDGGTFDREWEFDQAGETVLRIGVREDATKLDTIFVTDNVKAVDEASANVRLPDDRDREKQQEKLAVNPQNKAATTWGKLKQFYR